MHSNATFEKARKERNERPPRGNDNTERQQQAKRGKQWTREDKREQWTSFGTGM